MVRLPPLYLTCEIHHLRTLLLDFAHSSKQMGRHVPLYSPITFGRMGLKSGAQFPTDGSALKGHLHFGYLQQWPLMQPEHGLRRLGAAWKHSSC